MDTKQLMGKLSMSMKKDGSCNMREGCFCTQVSRGTILGECSKVAGLIKRRSTATSNGAGCLRIHIHVLQLIA